MKRYVALIIILFIGFVAWRVDRARLPNANTLSSSQQPNTTTPAAFNKNRYSIDQPGSIWWIVNKKRALPSGYTPAKLVTPAVSRRLNENMQLSEDALPGTEALFKAAQAANVPLLLASAFRSEAYQKTLYESYVRADGQAAADRYSARPGTSEHQTGLAIDVCALNSNCNLVEDFGNTPTGKWIAANAHLYGFIVRYPKGKETITGYQYEPWHLRYVGNDLAKELHDNGKTMEEFFGLTQTSLVQTHFAILDRHSKCSCCC